MASERPSSGPGAARRPSSGPDAGPTTSDDGLDATRRRKRQRRIDGGAPTSTPTSGDVERPLDTLREPKGPALSRLPKMPFELFLLLVVVALLVGTYAVITRGSLSDADARARTATDELAVATATASTLQETNGQLVTENEALTEQLAQSEQQLAEAEAAVRSAESSPVVEEVAVPAPVENDTTELEDEIDRLERVNEALLANVDSAAEELAAAEAELGSVDFARWVGELLASEDGVRIGGLEAICLGSFVIDDIGVDAIGAGLHEARSNSTNDVVVESMIAAIADCGLDRDRVFGAGQ